MSTINVPDDEKTIQGAVNRAHDGDTVVVHGESEAEPTVYEEWVNIGMPRHDVTGLTVKAEPCRSVKVLEVHVEGAAGANTLEGLHVEGGARPHAVFIGAPNTRIRDFFIHDAPWAAIYVDPSNPDLPGGTIENCHAYGCGTGFHTTGVGWRVLNNNIERLINRTGKDADYMRGWGKNLLIKGNHFHGTVQSEIGGAHVDGFQTFDKGERYMRGLRIEDNIIEDCHQAVILADQDDPGDVQNVVIYNNWIRNVWGMGVYVRNVVRDVRIEHNLFQNMGLKGVFVRWGAEVDVTANIFENAATNYHGDDNSFLTGGYNILNPTRSYPGYSNPTDLLDIDPELDAEGYQARYVDGLGQFIGRIRSESEPGPEEPDEGHEHSDIWDETARLDGMIGTKADFNHTHQVPPHTHVPGGVRPKEPVA